jgi:hypothetical protein
MKTLQVGQEVKIHYLNEAIASKVVAKSKNELIIQAPHLHFHVGQSVVFNWQDAANEWWSAETWVRRLDWDERPLLALVWPGVIEFLAERRIENRKSACLPAKVRVVHSRQGRALPEQPLGTIITELSSQGLCFQSAYPLSPGDKLQICIELPSGELIKGPVTVKRIFGVNRYCPQVVAVFDPSDRQMLCKWQSLVGSADNTHILVE